MAYGLLRCARKDGVVSKQVRANGLWYEGSAAPGRLAGAARWPQATSDAVFLKWSATR